MNVDFSATDNSKAVKSAMGEGDNFELELDEAGDEAQDGMEARLEVSQKP